MNRNQENRNRNWDIISNHLRDKTYGRMSDVSLIHSRGGLIITGMAFMFAPMLDVMGVGILNGGIVLGLAILAAALFVVAFILNILSLFMFNARTPIDPKALIATFRSHDFYNASTETLGHHLATCYESVLDDFNDNYNKKLALQLWSLTLVTVTIILIFVIKGVTVNG